MVMKGAEINRHHRMFNTALLIPLLLLALPNPFPCTTAAVHKEGSTGFQVARVLHRLRGGQRCSPGQGCSPRTPSTVSFGATVGSPIAVCAGTAMAELPTTPTFRSSSECVATPFESIDLRPLMVGIDSGCKSKATNGDTEVVESVCSEVNVEQFLAKTPIIKPTPASSNSVGFGQVRKGDTLENGQFTIVRKLGTGTFGAVYCARDREQGKYVAVKMQKPGRKYSQVALDEVELLHVCNSARRQLKAMHGRDGICAGDYVVELNSHFEYRGLRGSQVCMNLELLGPSLLDLVKDYGYKGLPINIVKAISRHMLTGIDFLHTCGIIHTDVKPENVLLSLPSRGLLPEEENALSSMRRRLTGVKKVEPELPIWWKDNLVVSNGGWSLRSGWARELFFGLDVGVFEPMAKLVDLGNACKVDKPYTQDIQTIEYRCPEVILGSGYSTPADVWSVACTVFELLTGEYLFDPKKSDGAVPYEREEDLLALHQELLGDIPVDLACGGTLSSKYFNSNGRMRHIYTLNYWGLSDVLVDKYGFSRDVADECAEFLLPMLHFDPEKRATAAQMLKHKWLDRGQQGSHVSEQRVRERECVGVC